MPRTLARRLLCTPPGGAAEAIGGWLARHPDAPVAAAPLDSGWMVYPGPGSAWGGCSGVGLDGPVSDDVFARLDAFFGPRAHAPMVLVCPYAHASLVDGLADHGFHARRFRQTMWRPATTLEPCIPDGVLIREEHAVEVIARGFADGADPTEHDLLVERIFDASPSSRTLVAYRDGRAVGGGRVAIADGLAVCFGASVLPEARRQGIHDALLRARMNLAAASGCDTVVVEGSPGGATERNALRLGFSLAFTQVIFRRP